ncbi:DEAD/DEAH box helicase [Botrimarina hoheduenensis]|uniref:ATP-dependent helicase HepA n=1 Tax=Botrimarina hoheduenensis TaxID=2528000 RepID=A0A5C5VX73_9BACT|nr:DEAD/DEAH box helicase [Botrimarina hoheduenensis]TWT43256.1 ATP-dependent helicase HepA [Botrimarina hoheduenensis]
MTLLDTSLETSSCDTSVPLTEHPVRVHSFAATVLRSSAALVSGALAEGVERPPIRAPRVESLALAAALKPAVVSLAIETPRIGVRRVMFAEPLATRSAPPVRQRRSADPAAVANDAASPARRRTRVRPPRDAIRLEDRLACLLQPPLEALLAAESLRFPFEPFDYQMDGVAFLYPRRHAVVADEMGLGKTMQAITTIRLLAKSGEASRVLLVCPKPLIPNWRRELATWAPELRVTTIEGSPERRRWAWDQNDTLVQLVGYETLVRDRDLAHRADRRFDLVLLDEAQRIKNRSGATHAAVCGLNRDRSWALTGTPIENSIDDLVGIFEFVSPGTLRPGMRPRQVAAAARDDVLRRTKERVLKDLPPKLIRDEVISLSPEQSSTYRRAEDEGVIRLKHLDGERELAIRHVFELVLRLKQICNFDPLTGSSSKAERLEAELAECRASGRKAIVFSQWVNTLDRLTERCAEFNPARYDGGMSTARREAELVRFREQADCSVLLMTYGAGSVGLNLQFAGYVFLFDRWWNPAVEDQAINRAHRIGASGPVTVTRLLCEGTLEERIDTILREKRELFRNVFPGDLSPASAGLSRNELLSIFNLSKKSARAAA